VTSKVVGSVVVDREAQGKVAVDEQGGGEVGAGAGLSTAGGLVLGLFAPPC
jgi:hypothetical protein